MSRSLRTLVRLTALTSVLDEPGFAVQSYPMISARGPAVSGTKEVRENAW
jgi:hypothetical protein